MWSTAPPMGRRGDRARDRDEDRFVDAEHVGEAGLRQRSQGDVEVGHAHRHAVVGDRGHGGGGRTVEEPGRLAGIGEGDDHGVGGEVASLGEVHAVDGIVVVDGHDHRPVQIVPPPARTTSASPLTRLDQPRWRYRTP